MSNLKKSLQNRQKQGKIKQVIIYFLEVIIMRKQIKTVNLKRNTITLRKQQKRIKGREKKINGVRVSPHTFAKFFLLNGGDV